MRPRNLALVSAAVAVFLALVGLFCVGRWLVVEDPLEKAQSIAVLSGGMPLRAVEAAKLYREGYAPEIWLTRNAEPAASLKEMGIPFVGEEFYNLRVLVHEGVPAEAIRVLPEPIINTADEMAAISTELGRRAQLEADKNRRVIIVTTKAHTRRVRTLWRKLAGTRGQAIVRAASGDTFDGAHWWRNTTDALDVVREVLGLLNAWAGLLLHPAKAS
jgi:uncharacterized SAM-binding protein YcdF (DUF218 family)